MPLCSGASPRRKAARDLSCGPWEGAEEFDAALGSLDITQPRLCFDTDYACAVQQHVPRPEVSAPNHWDFAAPVEWSCDVRPEALEEAQLGGISRWRRRHIGPHVQSQTERGRVGRRFFDRQVVPEVAFCSTDLRLAQACDSRHVHLAEACSKPCFVKLGGQSSPERQAVPAAPVSGSFIGGHPRTVGASAALSLGPSFTGPCARAGGLACRVGVWIAI